MYRIALCEDERAFAEEQTKVCHTLLKKLNIEHRLEVFDNAEDFLAAFSAQTPKIKYDLILLDIVMDETNGVELARKIRERDKDAAIVFITAYPEYAVQGYDVNALHYLLKPLLPEQLEKIIRADYERRFKCSFLVLNTGGRTLRLATDDIVCLETVGRSVTITLKDGAIDYSGKLSELTEELPAEYFVRCHVGYIVNLKNIKKLTRTQATTVTGKTIPVSRAYSESTQKAFLEQIWEI